MKKNIKKRITLINMISSFTLQIAVIISGFILQKLMLSYFGSEVNGLVTSINQFFFFFTILEGGITAVVSTNLYKPIYQGDSEKINLILKTAKMFYRKIGIIFLIYAFCLSIVYPLFFNISFSYLYIFSLVIILSVNLFIQYVFSITLKTLLNADKKIYVVSTVQIIIIIINILLSIISLKIYPSVHILKLINGIIYIIQPIFYKWYVNKKYKINFNVEEDKSLISQRWDGFAVNIAYFIHSSTDITLLTFFTNYSMVSVYSVYFLVTNGLKTLIASILNAINPSLGQAYSTRKKELIEEKLSIYELITNLLVFYIYSVAALLITPFVLLYTQGIADANYNQLLFGVLLVCSEGLYLLKYPHLNLAYSAKKFKELKIPAFIEALINIVVSVILVMKYKLIGVAIGTVVAMIYRLLFHVWFTKKIINRKQSIYYKKLFIFVMTTIFGIITCLLLFPPNNLTIIKWIVHALVYSVIMGLYYLLMMIVFFRNDVLYIIKYIKK